MEIQDFIQNVAMQYDNVDASEFTTDTEFKSFDEWNSLLALSIIAMVDDEYGIVISNEDIKKAKTVQDLYNIVNSK